MLRLVVSGLFIVVAILVAAQVEYFWAAAIMLVSTVIAMEIAK